MGVKPVAIAGTSIGALIGAAYAAGMSGKDIRHHVAGDRARSRRNAAPFHEGARRHAERLVFRRVQPGDADGRRKILRAIPAGSGAGGFFAARNSADGDGDRSAPARGSAAVGRTAASGARRLDRHSRPVPAGRAGWPRPDRRRRPPIRCRSTRSPGAPMSSSRSTSSARRWRNAPTCRASGKASTPRSWSWAAPSSPPNCAMPRPIS